LRAIAEAESLDERLRRRLRGKLAASSVGASPLTARRTHRTTQIAFLEQETSEGAAHVRTRSGV
jgi:hypothetical protein